MTKTSTLPRSQGYQSPPSYTGVDNVDTYDTVNTLPIYRPSDKATHAGIISEKRRTNNGDSARKLKKKSGAFIREEQIRICDNN